MVLGVNLTVLIGANVPKPAPRMLMEAFVQVEVTHSDEKPSGFQINFQVGRSGKSDQKDYQLINNPLIQPGNRVILIVTLNASAQVLMDGIITHQQFSPSMELGGSTFTITGEDVSVMMDLEEKSVEHPAQDEAIIVNQIISSYAKYGLIPKVVKPPLVDRPTINERIPVQQGTDLEYLQKLAQRFDYVFYVTPGPASGKNTAYWGPPMRKTSPQKALTVNMGTYTNVESINFQNNALSPSTVVGRVQDRKSNKIQSVQANTSDRTNLSQQPALNNRKLLRKTQFRETGRQVLQAESKAQAMVDSSTNEVLQVTGKLNTIRYGDLLELRGVVGLRGVGQTYDGLYYVKSVTHTLKKGEYQQSFTIVREGLGTTKRVLKV
ncbi:hypothetical protein [Nodularia sp. UHCC 0506]|uniref:phage late control D family protein n=1 Tax=Nodularia sp. UHCC 0506 TaxID=3110243 RepID=UPI002B1F0F80|nr:hypothetical protein [Nodularia sp. UHCC 0506]MEA5513583.1 hypothetical protein [Nodularia sp. UHCC 0506]